jgi:hypothetical protein
MPYKHTESRRYKFAKAKYKVTNWAEYNHALRKSADITLWFTDEAIAQWRPAKTGAPARPNEYADHAIETTLLIRQMVKLPFPTCSHKMMHPAIPLWQMAPTMANRFRTRY